jgi:hypothetical protein
MGRQGYGYHTLQVPSLSGNQSSESREESHRPASIFDRVHIRVVAVNSIHAVAKLAVAHVVVDLRCRSCDCSCETKSVDRPTKVLLFEAVAQTRHGFSQSRFVNLDHLASSSFEILDLVTKSKSNLKRLLLGRDIDTIERPIQNGDGSD